MKLINRALFQRSYLSLAAGVTVEPLLRMSHICQDFIFTCLYLEKDYVKKSFDQQIRWSGDLELVSFEEVNDFDELFHFELPANYTQYLNKPHYISMDEFQGYQRSFSEALHLPQYCLIYKIRRKSSGQVLTLYYIVTESFATLNLLSEGGRYMPRILEAIQAGELLTDPSEHGLLTRFFKYAQSLPFIFIRGFQPAYGLFSGFRSNALTPIGPMDKIGMDFSNWSRNASWNPGYRHDLRRYVKAFISPSCEKYILENQKPIRAHASLMLSSITEYLPQIPRSDVLVMGENLARNPAYQGFNIVSWESAGVNKYNHPYYSTDQQVDKLKARLKYMKIDVDTPLHIVPTFIFEDQGKQLLGSIRNKLTNPSYMYVHRAMDVIDLRLGKYELDYLFNQLNKLVNLG